MIRISLTGKIPLILKIQESKIWHTDDAESSNHGRGKGGFEEEWKLSETIVDFESTNINELLVARQSLDILKIEHPAS